MVNLEVKQMLSIGKLVLITLLELVFILVQLQLNSPMILMEEKLLELVVEIYILLPSHKQVHHPLLPLQAVLHAAPFLSCRFRVEPN